MENKIFDWILEIPSTIALFGNWLVSPLHQTYLPLSPLELLGIGGVATIIAILVVHIVRLFV